MTRKTTSLLRQQLATAEANDDAMASKLTSFMAWIDKSERNRHERDEALKAAIDEDRAAYLGEMRVMKADCAALIAELRGAPVHIEAEQKRLEAAE